LTNMVFFPFQALQRMASGRKRQMTSPERSRAGDEIDYMAAGNNHSSSSSSRSNNAEQGGPNQHAPRLLTLNPYAAQHPPPAPLSRGYEATLNYLLQSDAYAQVDALEKLKADQQAAERRAKNTRTCVQPQSVYSLRPWASAVTGTLARDLSNYDEIQLLHDHQAAAEEHLNRQRSMWRRNQTSGLPALRLDNDFESFKRLGGNKISIATSPYPCESVLQHSSFLSSREGERPRYYSRTTPDRRGVIRHADEVDTLGFDDADVEEADISTAMALAVPITRPRFKARVVNHRRENRAPWRATLDEMYDLYEDGEYTDEEMMSEEDLNFVYATVRTMTPTLPPSLRRSNGVSSLPLVDALRVGEWVQNIPSPPLSRSWSTLPTQLTLRFPFDRDLPDEPRRSPPPTSSSSTPPPAARYNYRSPEGQERLAVIKKYLAISEDTTAVGLIIHLFRMGDLTRKDAHALNPQLAMLESEIDWTGLSADVDRELPRLPSRTHEDKKAADLDDEPENLAARWAERQHHIKISDNRKVIEAWMESGLPIFGTFDESSSDGRSVDDDMAAAVTDALWSRYDKLAAGDNSGAGEDGEEPSLLHLKRRFLARNRARVGHGREPRLRTWSGQRSSLRPRDPSEPSPVRGASRDESSSRGRCRGEILEAEEVDQDLDTEDEECVVELP
jgi:hypothetical protein